MDCVVHSQARNYNIEGNQTYHFFFFFRFDKQFHYICNNGLRTSKSLQFFYILKNVIDGTVLLCYSTYKIAKLRMAFMYSLLTIKTYLKDYNY